MVDPSRLDLVLPSARGEGNSSPFMAQKLALSPDFDVAVFNRRQPMRERACALEPGGARRYPGPMRVFANIITDRGSKYAVSGGPCASEAEAKAFLTALRRTKKFAKATHNSWALLTEAGPIKNDDGESGAGMVILRMLERAGLHGHIIVVTRWYGGKHLGGDRFRHVQDAVRMYLERARPE